MRPAQVRMAMDRVGVIPDRLVVGFPGHQSEEGAEDGGDDPGQAAHRVGSVDGRIEQFGDRD